MVEIIRAEHVSKKYGYRFNQIDVLSNISFSIEKGEFVGIMGPSGAGKTTLLNSLATIDKPSSGKIWLDQQEITGMREGKLSQLRQKKLGFIFQDFNLIDSLTVKDNILLPLSLQRVAVSEMEKRVKEISGVLNIQPILERMPADISIGQKQRVAAARAMITDPILLFADEPTGSLDSKSATELLQHLNELNRNYQTSILMVTHDPFTASYCQRILFIKDGVIFAELVKENSRKEFFKQIMDMQMTIGGGQFYADI